MTVLPAAFSEPQVYSVWVPLDRGVSISEEANGGKAAQETVSTLCDRHRDVLPWFQAHITALGGLLQPQPPCALASLERSCAEVAKNASPFTASLNAVETGTTYFQSVYATFNAEARELLSRLHQQLEDAMDLHNVRRKPPAPESTYLPHVSLAYGNLSDERRAAIATEAAQILQQTLQQKHREGPGCAATAHSAAPLTPSGNIRIPLETAVPVCVDEIALVYTDLSKTTSTWRVVQRFPFAGR